MYGHRQVIRYAALVGWGATGTYMLILFAFRQTSASYVVAMREVSIELTSARENRCGKLRRDVRITQDRF